MRLEGNMTNKSEQDTGYQPETLAVHAGTARSQFGEHSEALFLTSSAI